MLLDPLFNITESLSPSFGQHCIDLVAYASCAQDERSILQATVDGDISIDTNEFKTTRGALKKASAICRSDHTLSFNV